MSHWPKIQSLPRWWPRAAVSLFIFGFAAWLYILTATPGLIVGGMVESESAQLQRSAYRLGIAHSTGYPIYTMIGYVAAQCGELLGQDPYTWVTYTSSIAGAIALVLFFQLALAIGNPPAALAATGLLAVTDTMWHLSTIAETQGLHAISIIGIFWLMVEHLRRPQKFAPLAGIALLAGVGLANHRTIVVSGVPAVLAVLMTGAWRKLSWRRWSILIALVVIPVLSYGYIFWRAADPHIVMGVRETWRPSYLPDLPDDFMIDYVLGTELNFNIAYPTHDFPARLEFVVNTLRGQLPDFALAAGLAGLLLLAVTRRRLGIILAVYLVGWTFFLMSWRLDWKATIYYHALLVPLVIGLLYLVSWPAGRLFPQLPKSQRIALLGSLFSLPIFALCFSTYHHNRPFRDLSNDRRGDYYLARMALIPSETTVFSGGWAPDSFILQEYIDQSGRRDIWIDPSRNVEDLLTALRNYPNRAYYITPAMRSLWGMYSESFDLPRRGIALSGTNSELFLQARPKYNPQLLAEAETAEFQSHAPITPEINLYSQTLTGAPEGIRLALYWQAAAAIGVRYSVFTHLRHYETACQADSPLRLLTQDDARDPVDGNYPTLFWESGEIIKDMYLIPWPDEPLSPSGLAIVVGMTLNGERVGEYCLPLQGDDGDWIDFAALGIRFLP